jgi:LemA protein
MLPTFITIIVIVSVIVLWIVSTQRRLVVLDENISNAMSQIGVQLSSRFDALTDLLDLTKSYAKFESETLIDTIKSRRSVITAKSTPDEVMRQEEIIFNALVRIVKVTEQYPELKANQTYIKTMGAVQTFENMVRTSRLIYNDSVSKMNREIRMFPVSMIAGMLGFRQREYIVEQTIDFDVARAHVVHTTMVPPADVIEEIKKYKTLMEDGVISQQEFDAKKRQLLGI